MRDAEYYTGRGIATGLEDTQIVGHTFSHASRVSEEKLLFWKTCRSRAATCAFFCGFSVFACPFDDYLVYGPISL